MAGKLVIAKHVIGRNKGVPNDQPGYPLEVTDEEYEQYMEAGAICEVKDAHNLIPNLSPETVKSRVEHFKRKNTASKTKTE